MKSPKRKIRAMRAGEERVEHERDGSITAQILVLPGVDSMDESERTLLMVALNDTQVARGFTGRVEGMFEAQAMRTPAAIALSCEGRELRYDELDARANRRAHQLRREGVEVGQLVGVCLARSEELVITLLAILKAGAAYVPLEATHPPERLRDMATDADVRLVVSDITSRGVLSKISARTLTLEELDEPEVEGALEQKGTPEDAMYVLYTSGSTGKPKGVVVEHRNVTNFLEGMRARLRLDESGTFLSATSYGFDISVLEMFGALAFGMKLVLMGDQRFGVARSEAHGFADELERHRVSHFQCTPSRALLLLSDERTRLGLRHVKEMLVGGEALGSDVAQRLLAAISGRLFNMYGPTETTVWSSLCEVTRDGAPISLGRPIINTTFYVLDEAQKPVPRGVPGELYIGGLGVARGYLNRPELTAERFVPDPFAKKPGARLYRTGDLVQYRADTSLEFLGRNDFQVKIRGFRIELGEIESALRSHAGAREAVVIARPAEGQEPELVAYLVPGDVREPHALREALRERLPAHMVPARYVLLEALPLTSSGKVDRKALPEPGEAQAVLELGPPAAARLSALTYVEAERASTWPGPGERWLVLLDETGFGDHARRLLEARGVEVIGARLGHGPALSREGRNDFRIDSDRGLEGPVALLRELEREHRLPHVILQLWTVTGEERTRSRTNRFHHDLERGYLTSIALAQGLFALENRENVRLVTVTNGALSVHGEPVRFPAKALVFGPVTTLAREAVRSEARVIDVELPLGLARLAMPAPLRERMEARVLARLLPEAKGGASGLFALRGETLYTRALSSAAVAVPPPRLRKGGCYVIVGGFGGLGHAIAEQLAERTGGSIALLGRTPLPERKDFAEWLENHAESDPVSQRLRMVEALEARGARVRGLGADVRHPESLRAALAQVRDEFGAIHGVVHAAGVLDEEAMAARSVDGAREAVSTEVLGARLLRELTAQDALDFGLLLGHAARFGPRAGMSARLAASHHAEALSNEQRGPWRSVDVGLVRDRGMYAALASELAKRSAREPHARVLLAQIQRGMLARDAARGLLDTLAGTGSYVVGPVPEPIEVGPLAHSTRRAFVPPVGELESHVAALWAEALGTGVVGAEDDFFELGGHSLVALRIGQQLREHHHVDVPLALFVEAPTVRGLSRLIERAQRAMAQGGPARALRAWTTVVPLHEAGDRPPLFCVGGRGGNVMNLRHLGRLLGDDQPVFGLQARGVDGQLAPHESFDAMVDEYLADMRRVRPHGPYFLAGFSGGGAVIVEMARKLVASGERVAPLVFLDAWNPRARPRSPSEKVRAHAELLTELGPRYLGIVASRVLQSQSRLFLRRHVPALARRIWEVPVTTDVERAWNAAAARYEPRPFSGKAVLFRVRADRSLGQLPFNDDPHNGWTHVLQGGIEVVDVPGDHNSLLEEPHVRTLAQGVRLALDRATRFLG